MKWKILHLITSLDIGGANIMLYKLLAETDQDRFEPVVIVMMDKGKLGESIEDLGIHMRTLGMSAGQISQNSLRRLRRQIMQLQPDLIQAWTYHSNIAASVVALLPPRVPVIWNIRHTPYDLDSYKMLTYLLIRYGKWLAWQPACTIYNSVYSANRHRELGYRCRREVVIPNGFDVGLFKPSATAYASLRKRLGLPESTTIIGMVARYHPMKDHSNFLKAAALLHQQHPEVHFVLLGLDVDENNHELCNQIKSLDLSHVVHLLGERSDVAAITSGLDIASLTSAWGDAFPNVMGEAMSCAVPCVVTDIGDSALIVGDTGLVIPPKDPYALCEAWIKIISLGIDERKQLGRSARQRIISNYSLSDVIQRYEGLYYELL